MAAGKALYRGKMATENDLEWMVHSEHRDLAVGLDVDLFDLPEPELDDDGLMNCALIPLRDMVMYPRMITPLFIGRERSIEAANAAAREGHNVVLVAQRDGDVEQPGPEDLFAVGTLVALGRALRMPDGMLSALAQGRQRVTIACTSPEARLYSAWAAPVFSATTPLKPTANTNPAGSGR